MTSAQDVYEVVGKMSDFIQSYALALAAVSVLAMALIEAVKALLKTREKYHMRQLAQWIATSSIPWDSGRQLGLDFNTAPFHDQVYRQLVLLTTGESGNETTLQEAREGKHWSYNFAQSLYALDLEKMMGQIQQAADAAMSNPSSYRELYLFLTTGAKQEDVVAWYKDSIASTPEIAGDTQRVKQRVDNYSRLNQLVRRRLDSFQLVAGYRWKTWNQTSAIALGFVILLGSLLYIQVPASPLGFAKIVLASALGGMVAPIAKDLLVALKKVRSGG